MPESETFYSKSFHFRRGPSPESPYMSAEGAYENGKLIRNNNKQIIRIMITPQNCCSKHFGV